ncbi:TetR family transcriptional regulator [Altererythrobacter xixiisoli]|uniref:TetR family transcriptional regulator n=1 Tax=Croceibacterium xixiisoli TaxID=1476466 RepID=A0A6I4TSV4_9SPHN|nr:TetR/AcrR family transcriptional regulator [Croceibacterium xixiisoli]MXO97688.1 TetR family transcriptional regulator [Croceibacterium xixiisoli]
MQAKTDPIECKRAARRQERRAAIVAVAQRHFTEYGYGATSMSAIAAELGGSKTTLWSYFSSKEELFAEALEVWIRDFSPISALKPEADLRQTLLGYGTEFLRTMLSSNIATLFRLVIAEASRFPEIGRIFYEHAPLRRHKVLAAYLDGQITAGRLRPVDSLRASAQLHHLCIYRLFMHSMWGLDPDISAEAIDREVGEAVDMFLHGYAMEGPPAR